MNSPAPAPERSDKSVLCAVLGDREVAIVRVVGRGTFINSVPLKRLAEHLDQAGKPDRFILELSACETMDSTFMGVLASISLMQQRHKRQRLVVYNANEHVMKLLRTLGLVQLLEVHEAPGRDSKLLKKAEKELTPAEAETITHVEQISHTLEAHKALLPLDDENESRFQSVIHYLEKSLEEEG